MKLDVNARGVILQSIIVDRSYQNRASCLFKEREQAAKIKTNIFATNSVMLKDNLVIIPKI